VSAKTDQAVDLVRHLEAALANARVALVHCRMADKTGKPLDARQDHGRWVTEAIQAAGQDMNAADMALFGLAREARGELTTGIDIPR